MHKKQKGAPEKVSKVNNKSCGQGGDEPRLFTTTFLKGGVQNATVNYLSFWQECIAS